MTARTASGVRFRLAAMSATSRSESEPSSHSIISRWAGVKSFSVYMKRAVL